MEAYKSHILHTSASKALHTGRQFYNAPAALFFIYCFFNNFQMSRMGNIQKHYASYPHNQLKY